MASFEYDVCIIGTGHVGLPLGLSFIEAGLTAIGIDRDTQLRETINSGKMPFYEPGYDALIATQKFQVYEHFEIIKKVHNIIITVGTPLNNHIETDLRQIQQVLKSISEHLTAGQLICLRSTVAPKTTRFIRRWIKHHIALKVGKEIMLAFCPERIVEGKAYQELRTLPQIIGTEDKKSRKMAKSLFEVLTSELLFTNYITAELVKLSNNITRYVHFALSNQLALVADDLGADIYEIIELANYNYPRNHITKPGLTGGTCLRKDFGMLNEKVPYSDMFLSAWKIHEYMPNFLVQHFLKRTKIRNKVVAVLGYTFKADTDDMRDSLAPKLYRYILRELPLEVRISDHYLPNPIKDEHNGELRNWPIEKALVNVDCIFVAVNHTGYDEVLYSLAKKNPNTWIVDIWNVCHINQIFYQASALKGLS
ncbi:MAG: nucleotide sugar dehydrogenase [Candidatus Parabeggiatoa sp.]|nr:nucleotide sugar dehydrogenase [Candidatus Parabeggiatoa sp.]